MRKSVPWIAITALICCLAAGYKMNNFQQASVPPEVRSLLDVISRLTAVNAVVDTSGEGEPPISVCFEDREALRPFTNALRSFRGNFLWMPLAQLPYICVVPVAEKSHIEVPPSRIRSLAIQDIASLARFLERELHLENVPSQGVMIRQMTKRAEEVGPGGPALLVANPHDYLSNGLAPTSARDRTVEYWISDEEGDLMYEKLHPSHGTASGFRGMALLERVCESKYEDLIILPSEVRSLKEECQRMADRSADLRPAMVRVVRVCDLALTDGLGIVVLGR
jgi:hypothetical protein